MTVTLTNITGTVEKRYQAQPPTPAANGDTFNLDLNDPPDWFLILDHDGDSVDLLDSGGTVAAEADNSHDHLILSVVKNVTRKQDFADGSVGFQFISDDTNVGISL